MIDLTEFQRNDFSQFGEDGMVDHLFELVGVEHYRCGEVGAGDGLELSNTARLWQQSTWEAVLVEADPVRFFKLGYHSLGANVRLRLVSVSALNVNEVFVGDFDLLSLDIDGDDWFVFHALETRPRIIIIEFNPSIPFWCYVRPTEEGHALGASALAMKKLGEHKGYRLAGASHCNLILLRDDIHPELKFQDDLGELLGTSVMAYMATDFIGRPFLLGHSPPWGFTGFVEECDVPMITVEEEL